MKLEARFFTLTASTVSIVYFLAMSSVYVLYSKKQTKMSKHIFVSVYCIKVLICIGDPFIVEKMSATKM